MHSQLALTEHVSLNLAPLILLDPVRVAVPSGPSSLVPEERERGHPAEPVGLVELGGGRVHPRLVHLRRVHRAGEELKRQWMC